MSNPRSVAHLQVGILLACLVGGLHGLRAENWKRSTLDDSSRGADGVRTRDVNADGHLGICTGWEEGGLIRVYLNPGPQGCRERWLAVTGC